MAFLPVILAAATEHSVETEGNLLGQFGIEGPFLLSQIISFCVVAFVLYRFAFKPVLATIDERQTKIADGLKYAEEMKAKLEDAEAQHKEIVQKASLDAQKIVNDARAVAEDRISKSSQEAVAQAGEIITKAEQQIELDRKNMLAEARSEIARLVVATTSKVLAKELSSDDKSRFTESASASLVDSSN
jgi:F-type H+-transporting ATPase subunit b